ncbi:hypothetical protein SEA_OTTAWA_26 [Arthrobacter phage Ottawa]|nr:hypothetical protein SEA_KHARCHO_26 [Arthrobacter phage Kharcho]WIC89258.1 hypothetical protein SEA_OTTAWA_26 [Arthrobacter phage Ottawa]
MRAREGSPRIGALRYSVASDPGVGVRCGILPIAVASDPE